MSVVVKGEDLRASGDVQRVHDQEVLASHANARLTVHGLRPLVQRVIDDRRPVAHVAKEMGVSPAVRAPLGQPLPRARRCRPAGKVVSAASLPAPDTGRGRGARHRDAPAAASWAGLDRPRAGGAGAHGVGDPAPSPDAVLARLRPVDPGDDPGLEDDRRALRATHPRGPAAIDVKKVGRIPDGGGWKAHGRG